MIYNIKMKVFKRIIQIIIYRIKFRLIDLEIFILFFWKNYKNTLDDNMRIF
jgi:hypothetical protein